MLNFAIHGLGTVQHSAKPFVKHRGAIALRCGRERHNLRRAGEKCLNICRGSLQGCSRGLSSGMPLGGPKAPMRSRGRRPSKVKPTMRADRRRAILPLKKNPILLERCILGEAEATTTGRAAPTCGIAADSPSRQPRPERRASGVAPIADRDACLSSAVKQACVL